MIVVDARFNLRGTVDLPILREVVRYQAAVVLAVATSGEPADEILPLVGSIRQQQDELFPLFTRQFHDYIVRFHLLESVSLPELLFRDRPQVFIIVEVLRLLHMVPDVLLCLDAEEVLGIAHMGPQRLRHVLLGMEHSGEYARISANYGVAFVPHIEAQVAGEGVYSDFHAIPHVVQLGSERIRVWIPVSMSIGILKPEKAAFCRYNVGVFIQ